MDIQPEELLLEISIRGSATENENSEKALCQFVKMFEDHIRRLIYTDARDNQEKTEDLYRLFILEIWEKAEQYDDRRSGELEPTRRVKFWLGSRLKAVLRSYRQELTDDIDGTVYIGLNDITWLEEESEEDLFFGREILQAKLELALKENKVLNAKEIDILKTSFIYNNEIPKEIRLLICKQYGITETTIRTIRFKTKKKIRDFSTKNLDFQQQSLKLL